MIVPNAELVALAEILADWVEPAPSVPAVYLFGSRVRGDHRHDSDVDVRLFLDEWKLLDHSTM
jgi:predicted nucleotidyltransferase